MTFSFFYRLLNSLCIIFLMCTLHTHAQHLPPKREFRGVWIASVKNIDWPSHKSLSSAAQQQEYIAILDEHLKSNLNAVIVQVRPATDAFYYSSKEPWSEWLVGRQGNLPQPYYDPLEFMIREAHKRGLEFHAWINPYRATFDNPADSLAIHPGHITRTRPDWFVKYGTQKIFNPGLPEVRSYITDIVTDVVRRYDIDGIHFDDYFYPYPIKDTKFEDDATFEKYGKGFSKKDDWRRQNVNLLIESVANSIRNTKPYVKFGISPFGVWRNKAQDAAGSLTTGGQTSYDHLYADVRLWLSKGWIDYVSPQVYFSMTFDKVPYQTLTEWWAKNTFGRHLYVGQAAFKMGKTDDPRWLDKAELSNQLRINRKISEVHGSIYFSSRSLTKNAGGVQDSLRKQFYQHRALVPAMPWKDGTPPNAPENLEAFQSRDGVLLRWNAPPVAKDGQTATYYVIYRFREDQAIDLKNPANIVGIHRDRGEFFVDTNIPKTGTYKYVVTAMDRMHNESRPCLSARIHYEVQIYGAEFLEIIFDYYMKHPKNVNN